MLVVAVVFADVVAVLLVVVYNLRDVVAGVFLLFVLVAPILGVKFLTVVHSLFQQL